MASCVIEKGMLFTHDNIMTKRPGSGINPMSYWDVIGTEAQKNYDADDLI